MRFRDVLLHSPHVREELLTSRKHSEEKTWSSRLFPRRMFLYELCVVVERKCYIIKESFNNCFGVVQFLFCRIPRSRSREFSVVQDVFFRLVFYDYHKTTRQTKQDPGGRLRHFYKKSHGKAGHPKSGGRHYFKRLRTLRTGASVLCVVSLVDATASPSSLTSS